MLKVNAGFARKMGEANYGSRGASVNVELELESHLVNDPDGLLRRIRELFELARKSVDAELTSGTHGKNGRNGQAPAGRNGASNRRSAPCVHAENSIPIIWPMTGSGSADSMN
jgi:hypothetical protein